MKNKLPIIAILAVSSQFALADAANDPDINGTVAANDAAPITGAATSSATDAAQGDTAATTTKLPPMKVEVGSSLQSKLDARMEFQLGPQSGREQEVASVN